MSQAKKQYVVVFWKSWWSEEFARPPRQWLPCTAPTGTAARATSPSSHPCRSKTCLIEPTTNERKVNNHDHDF